MKIIIATLILMFSFSTAYAGSDEVIQDYGDFLREQRQVVEPITGPPVDDGFLNSIWEYLGLTKQTIKINNRQIQDDSLRRANDALKDLHDFEPQKK